MSEELRIRLAVADDRADLESLQWRSSLANESDRNSLLENPDAICLQIEQIEAGQVFVLESSGNAVGFAALLSLADGNFKLDGLFVEPDMWRQGFGTMLVLYCIAYASDFGARIIYVTGSLQAEKFYTSCGFKFIGFDNTRFGAAIRMQLSLN